MKTLYEPDFYEVRAIAYAAKLFGEPVVYQSRIPDLGTPLHQRFEVDGITTVSDCEWAIEVKSYSLGRVEVEAIARKYSDLGFDRFVLIAPSIFAGSGKAFPRCECVEYTPDLKPLLDYYTDLENQIRLPEWVAAKLASGRHHFRYKLAKRGRTSLRWVLSQTDKRVMSLSALRAELVSRVPRDTPPIRVYWSVDQWVSPKDMGHLRRPNLRLTRALVFDVDGDTIHRPYFPCRLSPVGLCEHCIRFAKQHTLRLIHVLTDWGFSEIEVVFSGWKGFHVYVLDADVSDDEKQELLRSISRLKIRVDAPLTQSARGILGFPLSLHGHSLLPLRPIENLADLSWSELAERGGRNET